MMFPKRFSQVCSDTVLITEEEACRKIASRIATATDEEVLRIKSFNDSLPENGFSRDRFGLITKSL